MLKHFRRYAGLRSWFFRFVQSCRRTQLFQVRDGIPRRVPETGLSYHSLFEPDTSSDGTPYSARGKRPTRHLVAYLLTMIIRGQKQQRSRAHKHPQTTRLKAYVVGLCQADQILPRLGTRSCGSRATGFLSVPPSVLINIHTSLDNLSDFDMSSVHNHPGSSTYWKDHVVLNLLCLPGHISCLRLLGHFSASGLDKGSATSTGSFSRSILRTVPLVPRPGRESA